MAYVYRKILVAGSNNTDKQEDSWFQADRKQHDEAHEGGSK